MDKSPEFGVIEKVLNRIGDNEEQLEQSWIDHYISLADKLLKGSGWNEVPATDIGDLQKTA